MARIEKHIAFLVLFDPHAKMIEQLDEEITQQRIRIHRAYACDHLLGHRGIKGIEFQQTVPAFLHFQTQRFSECRSFRDEGVELLTSSLAAFTVSAREHEQSLFKHFLIIVTAVDRRLKRVQPAVIPLDHTFLTTTRDVRDVDTDRLRLPDTIQPTDPLLQKPRVQWQVK